MGMRQGTAKVTGSNGQREYNWEPKQPTMNTVELAGSPGTRVPVRQISALNTNQMVAGTHRRPKRLESGGIIMQTTQVFPSYGLAVLHRGDYYHPGGPIFDRDGTILGHREEPGWFIDGYKWMNDRAFNVSSLPPLNEWLTSRPHSEDEFEYEDEGDILPNSAGDITPDV